MSKKANPTAHVRRRKKLAWKRHPEDWYVEEEWINDRLFACEKFEGRIHDPACGGGRIVRAARRAGLKATGADIVKRARGYKVRNFFEQTHRVENIVCNVPFRFALAFLNHALCLAERKVALIVPTAWVNAEQRSRWLEHRMPLRKIWLIAPRPSMPPGNVANSRNGKITNGTTDYCYVVFEHGYEGEFLVGWLRKGDVAMPSVGEVIAFNPTLRAIAAGAAE